jgi:hypothetical protein
MPLVPTVAWLAVLVVLAVTVALRLGFVLTSFDPAVAQCVNAGVFVRVCVCECV